MSGKALAGILVANLLLNGAANGTGGLWPVYIARLGGGPAAAGVFQAAGASTLILGTVLAGWLADRYQRRKELFLVACLVDAASLWLMSRTVSVLQLTALHLLVGLSYGVALTLLAILCGLLCGETRRGRVFGLLSLTGSASMVAGGLVAGPVTDYWGFPSLLTLLALVAAACVLPGLLLHDVRLPRGIQPRGPDRARSPLGRNYRLILTTAFFGSLSYFMASLGRPIAMHQLGFSATAISTATAVGALVGLPAPVVLGWLSDRAGRKRLTILCTLAGLAGVLVLAWAASTWSFWGAAALLVLMTGAMPLMQALAADILPPGSLGMGLSLLQAITSVGMLLGSLLMGVALQTLGAQPAFLLTAVGPLLACALLLPVAERTVARERPLASVP